MQKHNSFVDYFEQGGLEGGREQIQMGLEDVQKFDKVEVLLLVDEGQRERF